MFYCNIINMRIFRYNTYEQASEAAYKLLLLRLCEKTDMVVGLPTGSTPLGLYKCMSEGYKKREFDYSMITAFNIDEYAGLDNSHPDSYFRFMYDNLFCHINIPSVNRNIPSGIGDLEKNCEAYDKLIESKGGIDLQVLGVGGNGHIGFNEPGTPFESTTHVVNLKEETRLDNARFFNSLEEVPYQAITMGIKLLMNAREIIFLAGGAEKAEAVYKMIHGPVTVDCPASVLQLHPKLNVFIDAAAGKLF